MADRWFYQRQWSLQGATNGYILQQRELVNANICELLTMADRMIEISKNPHHYRASPKLQTARNRVMEAIKALQDELDPR